MNTKILKLIAVFAAAAVMMIAGCRAPAPDELANYRAERNAMLARQDRQRLGGRLKLTQAEVLVDAKLSALKVHARGRLGDEPVTAAGFMKTRRALMREELYTFIQQLPKGSILRVHPEALGDYKKLVRMIVEREDSYICRSSDSNYGKLGFFGDAPDSSWRRCMDERSASDKPHEYYSQLLELWTLSPDDLTPSALVRHKVDAIFERLSALAGDEGLYKQYMVESLKKLRDSDNVQHVELRAHYKDAARIAFWRDVLYKVNDDGPRLSIMIIACVPQYSAGDVDSYCQLLSEQMLKFAKLRYENPDLIAGLDICGDEDDALQLSALADTIIDAQQKIAAQNWQLPLILQAGQSNLPAARLADNKSYALEPASGYNDNIADALLLGTKRIGYATAFGRRPGLWYSCRDGNSIVELCPISDMIFGYCEDLRDHIGSTLIADGVSVSINPDYPAVFGHSGCSSDFLLATIAWDLDLAAIKQMAMDSISHSSLTPAARRQVRKLWLEQWDMFIMTQLSQLSGPATSDAEMEAAASELMAPPEPTPTPPDKLPE